MKNSHFASSIIAGVCLACGGVIGGDLTPPAGPVAPTMKTLDEVEPRTPIGPDTTPGGSSETYLITEPGSYYLTGNIVETFGDVGIRINADDVSIDLMGFNLQGNGVSFAIDGISDRLPSGSSGLYKRITIRNGNLSGWSGDGIELTGGLSVIEDVMVDFCGYYGIWTGNSGNAIRRCVISNTGSSGIQSGSSSVVESCIVSYCGANGIYTGANAIVDGSIAHHCDSNGILSFNLGATVTNSSANFNGNDGIDAKTAQISNCQVRGNDGHGVHVTGASNITGVSARDSLMTGIYASPGNGDGSLIEGNVCDNNAENGIFAGYHCQIRSNTVTDTQSGPGIGVYNHCQIEGNLSNGSVTSHGIDAWNFCRIAENHVAANAIGGIVGMADNTIERNSVSLSGFTGISVDDRCRIVGNNSDSNASRGIYTSARECTIHDNRIANNTLRGIDCNGDRNFVFANFARDNGGINYEAPANNRFGVIVIPPLSGTILGFSDPDVMGAGTTDPRANFSY